jgi:hypothetical protein
MPTTLNRTNGILSYEIYSKMTLLGRMGNTWLELSAKFSFYIAGPSYSLSLKVD